MLKDLGLHLQSTNNPSLTRLEPDDLEATKRLCLSAYAWDKSISLCLGRRPALSEMPFHPSSLRMLAFDRPDPKKKINSTTQANFP